MLPGQGVHVGRATAAPRLGQVAQQGGQTLVAIGGGAGVDMRVRLTLVERADPLRPAGGARCARPALHPLADHPTGFGIRATSVSASRSLRTARRWRIDAAASVSPSAVATSWLDSCS